MKDSMEHEDWEPSTEHSSSWWIERSLYYLLPYLHLKKHIRVAYFVICVAFLSMLGAGEDFFRIEFLTGRESFFNRIFVKMGWGWTLSLITLLRISCLRLHSNWKQHLWNLLLRVSTLTFFYYIWCQVIFVVIEEWTGRCVKQGIVTNIANINKKRCLKMKDHEFYSVDISGHAFLLPYCIFSLMEESKELIYVLCLGQFLQRSAKSPSEERSSPVATSLSPEELKFLKKKYLFTIPFIMLATLCTFCLSVLWDLMLIVTTLYYHTILEKALGALLAIASWYIQYSFLFTTLDIL